MFLLRGVLVASMLSGMVLAADPVPVPMPVTPMPPLAPVQPVDPLPTPEASLQPQSQSLGVPPPGFEPPSPLSAPMPPVAPGLAPPGSLPELPTPNPPLVPAQPLGDRKPLPLDPPPVAPVPMPVPAQVPPGGIENSSIFTAKPRVPAPGDDELQRLLIARYNEAVKELKAVTAAYQTGSSTFETVINAAEHVLKSGLELGDKPADEIALLEQYLDYTKQNEAKVKRQYEAGQRGGESDKMHQATYLRLGAEIELLRAKRKAGMAK